MFLNPCLADIPLHIVGCNSYHDQAAIFGLASRKLSTPTFHRNFTCRSLQVGPTDFESDRIMDALGI